jgi:hypothetical protein
VAAVLLAGASGHAAPSTQNPLPEAQPAPVESGEAGMPGFFSAAQVERGRVAYDASCVECHATSEFQGAEFEWTWRRQTAWQLYRQIATTMPESQPGGLRAEVYVDIVAYLLRLNEYQVGSQELEPTREALEAIPLGAGVVKTKSSG